MKFEVEPYGNKYRFDQESDIVEISYGITGLRLTVVASTTAFTSIYLDVHFDNIFGFRFLDEGDLIAYWESDSFKSNHHIYQIMSGGWLTGESLPDGILSVTSSIEPQEWLIATTNGCITVLGNEPIIRELSNARISSESS